MNFLPRVIKILSPHVWNFFLRKNENTSYDIEYQWNVVFLYLINTLFFSHKYFNTCCVKHVVYNGFFLSTRFFSYRYWLY